MADYSRQTGVDVDVDAGQVQGLADKMVAANLIARPAHGRYAVVDPFVREVWRSRSALLLRARRRTAVIHSGQSSRCEADGAPASPAHHRGGGDTGPRLCRPLLRTARRRGRQSPRDA